MTTKIARFVPGYEPGATFIDHRSEERNNIDRRRFVRGVMAGAAAAALPVRLADAAARAIHPDSPDPNAVGRQS